MYPVIIKELEDGDFIWGRPVRPMETLIYGPVRVSREVSGDKILESCSYGEYK